MHRPALPRWLTLAAALAVPGLVAADAATETGPAPASSKQLTFLLTGNGHGEIGPCG